MTQSQAIRLTIPSHPQFLQLVRGMMERVALMLDLPGDTTDHIVLAVDEASSNIIKHAYRNDVSGTLEFRISLTGNRLVVTITDQAPPCDARCIKPGDLADLKPGGLGVYIIHQVMDQVIYTRCSNNRNRLEMTKFIDRNPLRV